LGSILKEKKKADIDELKKALTPLEKRYRSPKRKVM